MSEIVPPIEENDDVPILKFCHDQGLNVLEVGQYGTYPHSDNAIIQFESTLR